MCHKHSAVCSLIVLLNREEVAWTERRSVPSPLAATAMYELHEAAGAFRAEKRN